MRPEIVGPGERNMRLELKDLFLKCYSITLNTGQTSADSVMVATC